MRKRVRKVMKKRRKYIVIKGIAVETKNFTNIPYFLRPQAI